MADEKLTALFADNPVTLDPGDLLYTVENTGTTPASGALKSSQLMRDYYKITPSVTGNNLTVALKHLDGTDPSTDRPLNFMINGVLRSVSAALSVTKNAGTNWFGAGGAQFATKELDYFVYVGYNATDGVTLGFARIPYASLYSDFSATTTNELYCAISDISHAAAGDNYMVIGRFAATLSAGAGYTWTVPTYTNQNLIHKPIYRTRWLTYVPQWTGYSSAPGSVTGQYMLDTITCHVAVSCGSPGTSNATTNYFSVPFTDSSGNNTFFGGQGMDSGTYVAGMFVMYTGNAVAVCYKDWTGAAWTNSGNKFFNPSTFFYAIKPSV